MTYEIVGKLHKKFDTESKTNSFQAREFVIETMDSNYPQLIKFQLTQDKCSVIDNINEGEQLKVFFDLRGREWNGKYFTNLNAWKVAAETKGEADLPGDFQDNPFPDEFNSSDNQGNNFEDFTDMPF